MKISLSVSDRIFNIVLIERKKNVWSDLEQIIKYNIYEER